MTLGSPRRYVPFPGRRFHLDSAPPRRPSITRPRPVGGQHTPPHWPAHSPPVSRDLPGHVLPNTSSPPPFAGLVLERFPNYSEHFGWTAELRAEYETALRAAGEGEPHPEALPAGSETVEEGGSGARAPGEAQGSALLALNASLHDLWSLDREDPALQVDLVEAFQEARDIRHRLQQVNDAGIAAISG